MAHAISDLQVSAKFLEAYGVAGLVTYDLAEVRDLDYYTGITFEGFAPGLGTSLISGGRYDDLIGRFGLTQPAVGWAMTLDQALAGREMQGIVQSEPAADILVSVAGCPDGLSWVAEARSRGLQVEVDPLGLEPEALWTAARRRGIPRAVWPDVNTTDDLKGGPQGQRAPKERLLPPEGGASALPDAAGAGQLLDRPLDRLRTCASGEGRPGAWVVRDTSGQRKLSGDEWEEVARWLR